ncbi:GAF and ANTAR domain-containing protein [Alloalcanivorax gelatiniphagus]
MSVADARQRMGELADLARALAAAPDEEARLQVAVDAAVALVPGCDHAGITINEKRGLVTRASTDEVARQADQLQADLGEGPCLEVMRDQETLVSADLASEERWPTWAKRACEDLGVGSMMSLPIHTEPRSFGALSLYARAGGGFDADDLAVGQALAAHISVIISAERQIDQLGVAIDNRTVIGRAEGILMERLQMSEDQSFDYLRRVSSHTNRKLVDVAAEIASTRRLPDIG